MGTKNFFLPLIYVHIQHLTICIFTLEPRTTFTYENFVVENSPYKTWFTSHSFTLLFSSPSLLENFKWWVYIQQHACNTMLTSATFYNDIIVNYSVTKHVVNNKMTNLIWQNNIDNSKDLNIEKELVLEPNK